MIYEIVISLLVVTNSITLFLFFKQKNTKKERSESLELNEFLMDLLSGSALIKVTRIAPGDLIMRSPRGRE